VSSHQGLTLAPGVTVQPVATDPLVRRRSDITREILREGIRQLKTPERDALRLATREHLPLDAIAAQLGVENSQIEISLRSGLHALRQSLITQLGEG
jgi:DNA-directed RNA polymerase specialized sigma24 family protein